MKERAAILTVTAAELRRAVLAAAAALALVPVTATDSAAATCTADHFCLWEDAPHDSPMASFVNGTDDTGRVGLPGGGRTAQNKTQHDWCVWSKRDYGGSKAVIHPGEWVSAPFTVYSLLPETTWRCVT
ncbi:hypothetical protein SUDANB15_00313 [Streptomyces sp. enrichment culture]